MQISVLKFKNLSSIFNLGMKTANEKKKQKQNKISELESIKIKILRTKVTLYVIVKELNGSPGFYSSFYRHNIEFPLSNLLIFPTYSF